MNNKYNNTLNLPQTDFPMRASSHESEPQRVKLWLKENAYGQVTLANREQPTFTVHCGPPYANGKLHGGHLVPNMLKDMIVRSKSMSGLNAPFVPGWDCHGLPIEWQVEKNLQKEGKSKHSLSAKEFRAICREYASRWVGEQKADWQRMGCLADWQNPYITMAFSTEANIIRVLGDLAKTDLLYKDVKPVMWSPVEQTALAEAEIEYKDITSKAIYVVFDLANDSQGALVAWTTTPWTLPSNKAVAISCNANYAAIVPSIVTDNSLVQSGKTYWVAEALIEAFRAEVGIKEFKITKTQLGIQFIGLSCKQPIYGNLVPIVSGDHVVTETGTGIVHIAPAHGVEDFIVGKANGLNLEGYIDEAGRFDSRVIPLPSSLKALAGLSLREAEPLIIDELKIQRKILSEKPIVHSSPISWRSKAPLICRTTNQWFIALDMPYFPDGKTLRERAIEEIANVEWLPKEGEARIRGMITGRPDWCVSRQRLWGVPIAIFRNNKTGEYLLSKEIFESVANQVEKYGIDAWSELPTEELLPKGWLQEHKLNAEDLVREKDILDVWFDSGSSFAHALKLRPELSFPADVYLEGSDQHRGWFQSSLLLSTAIENKAPYKKVITHGFVVDGQGRKVSKSLGNGADAIELMDKYGADTLRLWIASTNYKGDLRFDDGIMKGVVESYRKVRNTFRYMISNLYDFREEEHLVDYAALPEMEKWILARYAQVSLEIQKGYENYDFHSAFNAALLFSKNELSGFYFNTRKDSLYNDPADSFNRRSCQTALTHILKGLTTHLTPLIPFTCDEAWRHAYGQEKPVYLERFYNPAPAWKDDNLISRWETILDFREKVNAAFEATLQKTDKIKNKAETRARIEAPNNIIEIVGSNDITSILSYAFVDLIPADCLNISFERAEKEKCPRCWKLFHPTGDELCGRCADVVSGLPKQSERPELKKTTLDSFNGSNNPKLT